ncbi:MAG: eukaryotic-like serine/threonine-protein kinase, partial [Chloroflexota bacterium]|nr:eukaryotic-like serine/threonine-protein kinase [Chloroflexota bacterium]
QEVPPRKGGNGLLIGGIVGGIVLLLLCCGGVGAYFATRPVATVSPRASVGISPAGGTSAQPTEAPTDSGGDNGLAVEAATTIADRAGFPDCDSSWYEQSNTLHVLICAKSDTDEAKAFFFTDKFIATDTIDPSLDITVLNQDDKSVTLEYGMFHPDDDDCCPSASSVTVTYHWDGTKVTTPDKIPTADPAKDPSRR